MQFDIQAPEFDFRDKEQKPLIFKYSNVNYPDEKAMLAFVHGCLIRDLNAIDTAKQGLSVAIHPEDNASFVVTSRGEHLATVYGRVTKGETSEGWAGLYEGFLNPKDREKYMMPYGCKLRDQNP